MTKMAIKVDFETFVPLAQQMSKQEIETWKNRLETYPSMTGWYHLDQLWNSDLISEIQEKAHQIQNKCQAFIVIGIGGSYLGSKAIIDLCHPYFKERSPKIYFAGTSLSPTYLEELWEEIREKEIIINVISKSGTTLEPAVAFDFFYQKLQEKYQAEVDRHIIVTTDRVSGTLRQEATKKGWTSFVVPEDVGGRYSVFTPVGLLPLAVAGIDLHALEEGTRACQVEDAIRYAYQRQMMYESGKKIESLTIYEPKLLYFAEWWKQLFGETQGKEGKGLFPVSVLNTRDLHSLGQIYQEGPTILFETALTIEKTSNLEVERYHKSLDELNSIAVRSVAEAHMKNEVWSNLITIEKLDERAVGELVYFFEVAAAVGALMLEVNPFDQPGVTAYKSLMEKELSD